MTRHLCILSVLAVFAAACAVDASPEAEGATEAMLDNSDDGAGLSPAHSLRLVAGVRGIADATALSFDAKVGAAARYTLAASLKGDGPVAIHYELDGRALNGATVSFAGGEGIVDAAAAVDLPAGKHTLQLVFDSGKSAVEYVDVVSAARPPIVMGMYNNTAVPPGAEDSTPESFRTIADKWMVGSKIKVDRQFDSKIPVSYARSAGAKDPANGNVSFLSIKPPHDDIAGVASGRYDAQIEALAATIPAGSYFTMYHEPEDDMTGAKFTAMFKRFYQVAKAANPQIQIGYVAMAYQWRPSSSTTAHPDDWWVGPQSTDFLAVDAYNNGWQGQAYSLDKDPLFQRWYKWAKTKNKPLILAEYGVESEGTAGFSDSVRATTIRKSIEWAWTQPQIKMVLWWNGTKATPGGKDHFLNPTTSLPQDRFPLARDAWNDMVRKYGSTGTSYQ